MATKLKVNDLPEPVRSCFFAIAKAAVHMYEEGMNEQAFTEFCGEVWRTAEMNGFHRFNDLLAKQMQLDLAKYLERLENEAKKGAEC